MQTTEIPKPLSEATLRMRRQVCAANIHLCYLRTAHAWTDRRGIARTGRLPIGVVAAMPDPNYLGHIRMAVALCSPKDSFRYAEARQLVVRRLHLGRSPEEPFLPEDVLGELEDGNVLILIQRIMGPCPGWLKRIPDLRDNRIPLERMVTRVVERTRELFGDPETA